MAVIDLLIAIVMKGANAFGLSLRNFIFVLLHHLEDKFLAFLMIFSVSSLLIYGSIKVDWGLAIIFLEIWGCHNWQKVSHNKCYFYDKKCIHHVGNGSIATNIFTCFNYTCGHSYFLTAAYGFKIVPNLSGFGWAYNLTLEAINSRNFTINTISI